MKNYEARLLKLERATATDAMRVTVRIAEPGANDNWGDGVVVYVDGVRQGAPCRGQANEPL